MGRIRTIKPEFFTSEDIVALSLPARLMYVAIWCEADREGRLEWKPRTFKIRYFPADKLEPEKVCGEIVDRGLVVLYGNGLAYIPTFKEHQHVNPRESASRLPEPTLDASARVGHASARVTDAPVTHREGREGKEGEGKEGECGEASSPPPSPVMTFPVVGGEVEWPLMETKLSEYRESYPTLDVIGEFRKALQWLRDNPANRKTPGGMPKILGRWLGRAQDSGRGRQAKPDSQAAVSEALQTWGKR